MEQKKSFMLSPIGHNYLNIWHFTIKFQTYILFMSFIIFIFSVYVATQKMFYHLKSVTYTLKRELFQKHLHF